MVNCRRLHHALIPVRSLSAISEIIDWNFYHRISETVQDRTKVTMNDS